ncbi:MAG TPA: penicillin-binding protein 1C [Bacteroidales bacterium]|nr:penicillin-binding protein 1C [Bacteroidales bacterium]HNX84581.1 penicillin-binding protein 1C [Bacteroidales bacterium]HPS98415.1 penicillin-binding protein 1C [Bacteroidales bacterium]
MRSVFGRRRSPDSRRLSGALRIVIPGLAALLFAILVVPMPSFRAPLSTVVEAADGTLLGARVAADGQWRFPPPDSLPDKYITCLINYEDRWFRWHPGVNPVAVTKALTDNIRAGETVRGGSTITMQVARMARGNPERTYGGKIIEMLSAVKLELFRSKGTILKLYAANAPFGGNTVGIEAAAWRYTGRGTADLTWAEAATLAVLPNAPALIYPGRNSERLKEKRDRLLQTLAERGKIDSLTCELAMGEPLPGAPLQMPSLAPHLTGRLWIEEPGTRKRTNVDPLLQREASELVDRHVSALEGNGIHNAAAVVVEVSTGNVVAWVGNSTLPDTTGRHGRDVDMVTAPRSTGSIMKPFLYAGLLSSGMLLPNALIPDIPTRFQGFRPENADFSYSGAVPAGDALARSLNIPAVRMLQMYEEERFLLLLRQMGFTTFTKPASHYGLSLILGGGEATLWELASAYASMARVLITNPGTQTSNSSSSIPNRKSQIAIPPLSPSSIWLTYEALRRVNRPETETGWQYFGSAPEVAWKTGTSFGFRDAWAIGTTPQYIVAVWAGNADGEGRPGLSGIASAAPLLFDIIRLLPPSASWFAKPDDGMTLVEVCAASGYRAGPDCTDRKDEWVPEAGLRSEACPYHTIVSLDPTETWRVNSSCAAPGEMVARSWFVLPPAMEYYYRMRNPSYRTLPPFRQGCSDDMKLPSMEFIYPSRDARIFIPRSLQGQLMSMLPEIAHRRRNATVYWHLDNQYIGMTRHIHQTEIRVGEGEHLITAVDEEGMTVSRKFYCIGTL